MNNPRVAEVPSGDAQCQKNPRTISKVFEEFLADQEARLSPEPVTKYRDILSLYESYLESYWPGQGEEDYRRITGQKAVRFVARMGPRRFSTVIPSSSATSCRHKVVCGKEMMKAAGTVTKALAKWLAEKGYATDTSDAQERAKEAATDLPAAQDVLELLEQYVDEHSPLTYQQEIEDHFWIKKIEPGKLSAGTLDRRGRGARARPGTERITEICQRCGTSAGSS